MRIFITYAREDASVVAQIEADLHRSHQVWIDQDLTGGQAWWDEILSQIRSCKLYVFVLSNSSLRSRACLRELEYSQALGRPLLPIRVEMVSIQQAPRAIADAQVIDYVERTPESVLALRDALDAAPPPPPLPDPLPTPPEVPISYFGHYREQLSADFLPFPQQQSLLLELKNHLGSEEDREDALDLLKSLRKRPDLAQSVAGEIDALVAASPGSTSAPESKSLRPVARPPIAPPPKKRRTGLLVFGIVGGTLLALFFAIVVVLSLASQTAPECPEAAGVFAMPNPDTDYGPFGPGYYLVWHQPGGFTMYDVDSGQWAEFPDPGGQMARDSWQSLPGSPFEVCVDSVAGNVFGRYAP